MEDAQAQGGIADKAALVTLAQGRAARGSPEWAATGGDVATAMWQLLNPLEWPRNHKSLLDLGRKHSCLMSLSPPADGFEIPSWLHLVFADNPQPQCDLLAGQVCKDNLSIPDWDRTGNSLTPRSITPWIHRGTPKSPIHSYQSVAMQQLG